MTEDPLAEKNGSAPLKGRRFSDYLVFVDESGSPALGNIDPDFPLLVLAFMIVRKDRYLSEIVPAIQGFKFRHFGGR